MTLPSWGSSASSRVLAMTKNRFGGAGHRFYLDLKKGGFRVVAKLSA